MSSINKVSIDGGTTFYDIEDTTARQLIDDTVGFECINILNTDISILKAKNTSGTWTGNTYVKNNVTIVCTVNDDGQVTNINIDGTPSSGFNFDLGSVTFIEKCILSGITSGSTSTTYLNAYDGSNHTLSNGELELTAGTYAMYVRVQGATTNFNVKPMIRKPIYPADYEPYHASVEESKADNTVIAPVENGPTTSQAYAVGSHAIRNGTFITWKNAKAQGESIADSDYDSGQVGDVIFKLYNKSLTVAAGSYVSVDIPTISGYYAFVANASTSGGGASADFNVDFNTDANNTIANAKVKNSGSSERTWNTYFMVVYIKRDTLVSETLS